MRYSSNLRAVISTVVYSIVICFCIYKLVWISQYCS